MSDAPNADVSPATGSHVPHAIAYATPATGKPRITFRGAVVTLCVGAGFLLLTIAFVFIAGGLALMTDRPRGYRASSLLEGFAVFTAVLSALSFVAGVVVTMIGLRGVRQREMV